MSLMQYIRQMGAQRQTTELQRELDEAVAGMTPEEQRNLLESIQRVAAGQPPDNTAGAAQNAAPPPTPAPTPAAAPPPASQDSSQGASPAPAPAETPAPTPAPAPAAGNSRPPATGSAPLTQAAVGRMTPDQINRLWDQGQIHGVFGEAVPRHIQEANTPRQRG